MWSLLWFSLSLPWVFRVPDDEDKLFVTKNKYFVPLVSISELFTICVSIHSCMSMELIDLESIVPRTENEIQDSLNPFKKVAS